MKCVHLSSVLPGSAVETVSRARRKGRCGRCGMGGVYACTGCPEVLCRGHAHLHQAHSVSVDLERLELYCSLCRDQVYDPHFDRAILLLLQANADATKTKTNKTKTTNKPHRPRLAPHSSTPLAPYSPTPSPPRGLRGLNNLGNTCFINSVLQALLHTPPLRNFFLADSHNRYACRASYCLPCQLDAMFSLSFSGHRTPFTPATFLYSWWQHASNFASYEQQDAHEFFISILDGVHEKLQINQDKPQSQVSNDCCIAHKVFSGILRSDVMCTACGFTSTTYDPCVDISLDLEPIKGASAKTSKKSKHNASNINLSQNSRMASLMGCLDRFTRPERLGSDQKFFCQQCQVRQESLKQMSICKLPIVSCFHIKRFEHSSFRKMTRKVDSYLQFPFSLDLAPYLSSSILKSRFGNRMFYFDGGEFDASNDFSSEFELFAVITHKGRLDAGHYVTYLRLNNQWYKCDDAWITQVSDNDVRASQGYMMFYVQKMLYYKASESSEGSDKPT